MLIRRDSVARPALLAVLLVFLGSLAGCAKRSLSTTELRGVTAEVVFAAGRVTGHRSQISIRPEFEPSWFGGGGHLVADDVDVPVESPSEVRALAQALAQIARRHRLSFSETSSPGTMRFDFAFRGRRTHSIFVSTPAGAASRAPVENFTSTPRLAIIIDDLGRDPSAADAVLALPFPFTASVLPNLPFSADVAEKGRLG
ncbi:MAG: divergent polysaccharide deacetylase family protein, partial [Candidatus Acidiferrales bacterium]